MVQQIVLKRTWFKRVDLDRLIKKLEQALHENK